MNSTLQVNSPILLIAISRTYQSTPEQVFPAYDGLCWCVNGQGGGYSFSTGDEMIGIRRAGKNE